MKAGDGKPMLGGLKVLDLTTVVFGPYCTQILADFGAEVIKVEAPGGDVLRHSARSAKTKGMAPAYLAFNRGKRSLVLDLKDEADKARFAELLAEADVFIHNVREEAITRLGFDYESVKAANPEIVYVHCVGFGSGGPYEGLQAYDDVIQAASGAASLLPRVDGNPAPRYLPSLIADKVAGLHAAYASMAALIHKLRTGKGQCLEVPMFEAFSGFMMKEHMGGTMFDPPAGGAFYARQVDPDRQPFPTQDGYVSIVPYQLPHFLKVIAILGDPEFAQQERFETPQGIIAASAELYRKISELSVHKTSDEVIAIMREHAIPAMPVRDMAEMHSDPHLRGSGFLQRSTHPSEGDMFELREPTRFSGWEPDEPRGAPNLGSHKGGFES
ncbi:CaiB/BaiF CoA transferase family protein [Erythrobacter sp. HA6-11]